jgi:hypothetical protein
LEHSDVETPDLKELGDYITALSGAGMPLFPDDQLEDYCREAASLPAKPKDSNTAPKVEATQQNEEVAKRGGKQEDFVLAMQELRDAVRKAVADEPPDAD